MVEVDKIHFGGAIATDDDGWGGWVFEDRFLSCESAFVPYIDKFADGEEGAIGEVWEDGGFAGDGREIGVWEVCRIGGGDDSSIGGTDFDWWGGVISVDDGGIRAKIIAGAAGVKYGTTGRM